MASVSPFHAGWGLWLMCGSADLLLLAASLLQLLRAQRASLFVGRSPNPSCRIFFERFPFPCIKGCVVESGCILVLSPLCDSRPQRWIVGARIWCGRTFRRKLLCRSFVFKMLDSCLRTPRRRLQVRRWLVGRGIAPRLKSTNAVPYLARERWRRSAPR